MSKSFASPYTSTAIMSLMAGLQCSVIGVGVEWRLSAWALGWDIRLAAVLYIVSILDPPHLLFTARLASIDFTASLRSKGHFRHELRRVIVTVEIRNKN